MLVDVEPVEARRGQARYEWPLECDALPRLSKRARHCRCQGFVKDGLSKCTKSTDFQKPKYCKLSLAFRFPARRCHCRWLPSFAEEAGCARVTFALNISTGTHSLSEHSMQFHSGSTHSRTINSQQPIKFSLSLAQSHEEGPMCSGWKHGPMRSTQRINY